jgi:hypothetical protein
MINGWSTGQGAGGEVQAAAHDRLCNAAATRPNGKLYKRRVRDPYWAGRERVI